MMKINVSEMAETYTLREMMHLLKWLNQDTIFPYLEFDMVGSSGSWYMEIKIKKLIKERRVM